MAAKISVTQQGNGSGFERVANGGATPRDESYGEEVDEVAGAGESVRSDDGSYRRIPEDVATESAEDPHGSMSSPPYQPVPAPSEAGDEAAEETADTESVFDAPVGWKETQLTESSEEQEPLIEAYYAEAQSEEFFPALGALLAPLMKVVLPQIAGAVVQQGAKVLSPKLASLLDRLRKIGLNPAQVKAVAGMMGKRTEAYQNGGESQETDEAALEALEQQIAAMEVVIGYDDRVQVNDTKEVPFKRICHLRITAANRKTFLGTGSFIGPRTILTAGHCVYMASQGGWVREIVVTPGRNAGVDEKPFGTYTASSFRSVRGWVLNNSRNYDYGAIVLPRSAVVDSRIGAFGFGAFTDSYLRNKRLNLAGYPGDKPSGTMWFHGRKAKAVLPDVVIYDIDTAGGQSGSPVWVRNKNTGKRLIMGIHTNGAQSGNSATRIIKPVFENLKKWRAEGGIPLKTSMPASRMTSKRASVGPPTGEGVQPSVDDM